MDACGIVVKATLKSEPEGSGVCKWAALKLMKLSKVIANFCKRAAITFLPERKRNHSKGKCHCNAKSALLKGRISIFLTVLKMIS